jgi:plasmid stabilization system protein ParE
MLYSLSRKASQDLIAIEKYLVTAAGPEIALAVITRIRARCAKVARNPGLGHFRKDLTGDVLRFCREYSYLIVYIPKKPIRIVRVLHGKRDIFSLLKPPSTP